MAKVKEKLYEHRFGLFFFSFLVICCFYAYEGFLLIDSSTTKSIYAVDFSLGYCDKLLPGAIFNAVFNNQSQKFVSGYVQVLIYICFGFISAFLEKFTYKFEEKERKYTVILSVFLLLFFSVSAYRGIMFLLLDLHWLLALFLFLFFLSKKQLYIFIPIPFLYAIAVHYGSAMCYIPLFVLIMLVKIYYCEEKKERRILWTVLAVSFVFSVALFLYFAVFGGDNINISPQKMHELLASRGVETFALYDSYFNPEYIEQQILTLYGENAPDWIVTGAYQTSAEYFIPFFLERIKWHLAAADHIEFLVAFVINLPIMLFIIISLVKRNERNLVKKFFNLLAVCLSLEIVVFGLLLSEDTERWVGHAAISLMVYFAYVLLKDEKLRKIVSNNLKYLSPAFLLFVFVTVFLTCRI